MATLAVERMAGAVPGAHVSLAASSSSSAGAAAASLSAAGWSQPGLHRRLRRAGTETRRFVVGGRGASGTASLVCRSSVSPLSDSDGNVSQFQSEEEFNSILGKAGDKLVVVDISTTTCGPCKMIYPKLVEMSLAYPNAVFLKINGDTNNETRTLMRKWEVRAVPNFRFFKNGKKVHSHSGAKIDELKSRFAEHYEPIKVEVRH